MKVTAICSSAVALATERRPNNPRCASRVDQACRRTSVTLILDGLRREAIGRDMELTVSSVPSREPPGSKLLRCLHSALPLPRGGTLGFPVLGRAHDRHDICWAI
jgi:hypothetical protein